MGNPTAKTEAKLEWARPIEGPRRDSALVPLEGDLAPGRSLTDEEFRASKRIGEESSPSLQRGGLGTAASFAVAPVVLGVEGIGNGQSASLAVLGAIASSLIILGVFTQAFQKIGDFFRGLGGREGAPSAAHPQAVAISASSVEPMPVTLMRHEEGQAIMINKLHQCRYVEGRVLPDGRIEIELNVTPSLEAAIAKAQGFATKEENRQFVITSEKAKELGFLRDGVLVTPSERPTIDLIIF